MKQILTIATIMGVLASCNPPAAPATNMAAAENEKIVRQMYNYFNKHDWANMASLYADTADFRDPSLGTGIVKQTKAETIKKYTALAQVFTDVRDDVVSVYPSGDKHVVVEFVSSGTGPDGVKFELPICTIFTIENGKITKDFTYYDNFEEPKEGK